MAIKSNPFVLAGVILGIGHAGLALAQTASLPAEVRVCFEEHSPPFAFKTYGETQGFDVDVARELAQRVGVRLSVRSYEGEYDDNTSVALDANALLSSGVCDLVAGYALVQGQLGKSEAAVARVPAFDGGPRRAADRAIVTLGTLQTSLPYRRAALTVVLRKGVDGGSGAPHFHGLGDLRRHRIGVITSTMASAVALEFNHGEFAPNVVSFGWHDDPLSALDQGSVDAVITDMGKVDAYRKRHPGSAIVPTGYVTRVGVNVGFVGLSKHRAVLAAFDDAIRAMRKDGALVSLARKDNITYVAPTRDHSDIAALAEKPSD